MGTGSVFSRRLKDRSTIEINCCGRCMLIIVIWYLSFSEITVYESKFCNRSMWPSYAFFRWWDPPSRSHAVCHFSRPSSGPKGSILRRRKEVVAPLQPITRNTKAQESGFFSVTANEAHLPISVRPTILSPVG